MSTPVALRSTMRRSTTVENIMLRSPMALTNRVLPIHQAFGFAPWKRLDAACVADESYRLARLVATKSCLPREDFTPD